MPRVNCYYSLLHLKHRQANCVEMPLKNCSRHKKMAHFFGDKKNKISKFQVSLFFIAIQKNGIGHVLMSDV